jgi:TrkA domain protein
MEIQETALPGVGLRQEFTTSAGRQLGVVSYRTGRRELLLYDPDDPDACREVIRLIPEEADALADLLGAARPSGRLAELQQRVEGLAISWLTIHDGSPYARGTIADTQARSRTGVSIVAVLREQTAFPAPTPDFGFQPGDTAVVIGTPEGVKALAGLLGELPWLATQLQVVVPGSTGGQAPTRPARCSRPYLLPFTRPPFSSLSSSSLARAGSWMSAVGQVGCCGRRDGGIGRRSLSVSTWPGECWPRPWRRPPPSSESTTSTPAPNACPSPTRCSTWCSPPCRCATGPTWRPGSPRLAGCSPAVACSSSPTSSPAAHAKPSRRPCSYAAVDPVSPVSSMPR